MASGEHISLEVGSLFRELPAQRNERWDLLKHFFAGWFGQLSPSDGYTEQPIGAAEERLRLVLPAALRKWYALAGRRKSVWSCQDSFLGPEELRIESDKLIIYIENQAVVKWAIPLNALAKDDPAVFVSDQHDPEKWVEEAAEVSTFALSQMLLAAKFSSSTNFCANGQATRRAVTAIARNYQKLDLPDLHWPPYPTRFYGDSDLIIETDADTWIWVSGRAPATFRRAVELIESMDVQWEQVKGS